MAIERGATTHKYSKNHYCKAHQKIVDRNHRDECELIQEYDYKISEIVDILKEKESLYDLDQADLMVLHQRLTKLKEKLDKLVESGIFVEESLK